MTIASEFTVDTLIDARWIIPVEPTHQTLLHHSIAISNGKITAILPTSEAHTKFTAKQHFQLKDHALIPGLINLHTHAAMSLLRGLADDLPLMNWLKDHIWPAESRHASPEFVKDGTLLACAEMIQGGITTFNDMYFFPEAAAEAALASKMRAALGLITIDFPTAYASDADDYLSKGLAMRDRYNGENLLSFCMAPHAPYTVGDETLAKVLTYAEQLELPIHIHLHETLNEIEQSLTQYHQRPIQRLHNLGLLTPSLLAVHAVHLTPQEITLLAKQGCHVAHCPTSNLKLASGIAPVDTMLAKGINIGLGTDGAASNNRLDMFAEMRLAALLAKGSSGKAEILPAYQALEMATLNAAKALGIDALTGSLKPGKAADITAVNLSALSTSPCYDAASHLIYASGREHVSHVWVNGDNLLNEGKLVTLDSQELKAKANYWQGRIKQ
ncbi:TRZ/ATZ family hydrolase [Sulfurirhabdus autotrophica]|uniref:5-methylthioadenosine/S-adenosylhomocysteine deaminase n=1 Tax=Sulfurirhabdus autotrophica TaxID=1706046 RepID=A0A4R3YEL5_9PROT|nr:TRZ/ATZ family hydrolase [Sulfurirhabdus autotrophica]TCV90536.1 5-methylthioadenosine/S-adenosylhomocysteine deaminase [Sulfurirhabdus autotrophica]